MAIDAHKEILEFQAEARQLLKLVIHSLYSNKEIFLRELISNASDACDKLRFEALTDDGLYEGDPVLKVRVSFDRSERTLTISDNGIGMSRHEVAENIGTIARSGTRRFIEALTEERAGDLNLIGQFGVGFYSAFIVADRVSLRSRRAGLGAEHGVAWESSGEGQYSIETVERPERGTEIVLHLREGEDDFLDPYRLRTVIRRYSDNLSLPIEMPSEDEARAWEMVNRASALWTRPRKEITESEYHEFYKHIGHDFDEPLGYLHAQVEGTQSYILLLYIPRRAPLDLWERDRRYGIKLYVRRVFVLEDTERLMPNYLRFVRGVVDSDDLPLNVSREILQHNRQIDAIRGAAVKRLLGALREMAANEPEKYGTFWSEFGRVLKEGPVEDPANREAIAALLRFASTLHEREEVSLDDYIARMKEGQDRIYYLTAESRSAAANSPHLEIFRTKGVEVLLLGDRVDEWMLSSLTEYHGKPLHSVAKGDLELGALEDAGDRKETEAAASGLQDLLERMKDILSERVETVRLTRRLTDSASCLVVDKDDMTLALRRLLESAGQKVPPRKPILEINPGHALIEAVKAEADPHRFEDWVRLLYDQAMLSEGGQLDDPVLFVKRLNGLLLDPSRTGPKA